MSRCREFVCGLRRIWQAQQKEYAKTVRPRASGARLSLRPQRAQYRNLISRPSGDCPESRIMPKCSEPRFAGASSYGHWRVYLYCIIQMNTCATAITAACVVRKFDLQAIKWPWLCSRGSHVAESPGPVFISSQSPLAGPLSPPRARDTRSHWRSGAVPSNPEGPAHSPARFPHRMVSSSFLRMHDTRHIVVPTLILWVLLSSHHPPLLAVPFFFRVTSESIESNASSRTLFRRHPDRCPTSRFTSTHISSSSEHCHLTWSR